MIAHHWISAWQPGTASWFTDKGIGIHLELPTAIALFMSVTLLLVFSSWIFYNLFGHKEIDWQTPYMQQCPYCSYIFFEYHPQAELHCPRCASLFNPQRDKPGEPWGNRQHEKHPS